MFHLSNAFTEIVCRRLFYSNIGFILISECRDTISALRRIVLENFRVELIREFPEFFRESEFREPESFLDWLSLVRLFR